MADLSKEKVDECDYSKIKSLCSSSHLLSNRQVIDDKLETGGKYLTNIKLAKIRIKIM